MANNIVEALAQLYAKDPKRANWLGVPSITGTNDFGFIKVRHVEKVIPSTVYDFNFRCAFSSNPTISPVLSRAKVTVCGIWIPMSLYVPALRDGAVVEALKTDYSFPTINFDYYNQNVAWNTAENSAQRDAQYYYIPANSIFTELQMFEPYYSPVSRYVPVPSQSDEDFTAYPKGKNAIPLLGYYDFFRYFILNNQQRLHPIRTRGFSRRYDSQNNVYTQEPADILISRNALDGFFNNVRKVGNGGTRLNLDESISYPQGDDAYNISGLLANLYFRSPLASDNWAPVRPLAFMKDGQDDSYVWYNDDHFGEVRATYFGDFNTAYMSNENVEYERSSARVKADDDGYIDMEQIYAAQRVQNFVRRSIFKENDYSSFINAETGITPPTNLTKPLFLGSVSSWINYNDVISQSQTGDDGLIESNQTLGSRASLGFGRMVTGSLGGDKNQRSFVRFTAKEPGFFMLLEWIVPEVSYWQGYHPMYDKTTLMSLYYPAFDRSGFQDQQLVHLAEQISSVPNIDGSDYSDKYPVAPMSYETYNIAPMQVPAYWEHMVYRNRLCGQMVDASNYLPWNFHRDYDLLDYAGRGIDNTGKINTNRWSNPLDIEHHVTDTYVFPEAFHNIYANTEGVDNIQCYYKFRIKKYQPMSHRFLSF